MGAKQSKRSVDISGKEAEGGEVAAAGAGGEGRVEQLADADALKPQLNGAAHIQHTEQTDKEKELDSGTPENEKDATTEKEGKEEDDKEKETAAVTNGESEPKVENGESTPTPEDGKKPKKEKVKKKWSLRSISFSRKDKPKQEKKQKDEEPKTNGEPEKVPEETAEAVPEAVASEVAEEVKAPAEEKEEKTPETPVTEPLTNGTSTPESTAAETPASEQAAPALSPPAAAAPEPLLEPDQLPVNGLSLEEPKPEIPEVDKPEETKPELPVIQTAEIVPAPEIPKEVCVERVPLLEPTPPPLPANPPPSSVASFAATTMAPQLTDASLPNTADVAIAPLSALPETKDIIAQPESPAHPAGTEILKNDITFVTEETKEEAPELSACEPEVTNIAPEETSLNQVNVLKQINDSSEPKATTNIVTETKVEEIPETVLETAIPVAPEPMEITDDIVVETPESITETPVVEIPVALGETAVVADPETLIETAAVSETIVPEPIQPETLETCKSVDIKSTKVESPEVNVKKVEVSETVAAISETSIVETETIYNGEAVNKAETPAQSIADSIIADSLPEPENIPVSEVDISEADDCSLPPPPMQDDDDTVAISDEVDQKVEESLKQIPEPITEPEVAFVESNHISEVDETKTNGHDISPEADDETESLKKMAVASAAELSDGAEQEKRSPRLQNGAAPEPEPAAHHTPQEPLPVSDKLADLIPEVPDVPELKPETLQETATDVAVAN